MPGYRNVRWFKLSLLNLRTCIRTLILDAVWCNNLMCKRLFFFMACGKIDIINVILQLCSIIFFVDRFGLKKFVGWCNREVENYTYIVQFFLYMNYCYKIRSLLLITYIGRILELKLVWIGIEYCQPYYFVIIFHYYKKWSRWSNILEQRNFKAILTVAFYIWSV